MPPHRLDVPVRRGYLSHAGRTPISLLRRTAAPRLSTLSFDSIERVTCTLHRFDEITMLLPLSLYNREDSKRWI